mgnify:CR=1 FL=1
MAVDLKDVLAMDEGRYQWVGELSPEDVADLPSDQLTLARIQNEQETRREKAREMMRSITAL